VEGKDRGGVDKYLNGIATARKKRLIFLDASESIRDERKSCATMPGYILEILSTPDSNAN
jgi:hypothetical protein